MSTDGEKDKQLAFEELQKALIRVDPFFVNHYCNRNEPITGVSRYACVVLVRGKDGPYYANATGWGDYKADSQHLGTLKMHWIYMLAKEDVNNGCKEINVNKQSNPHLYWRVIRALAKQHLGKPISKDQKNLIKNYVRGSFYINLQHQQDITLILEEEAKNDGEEKPGKGEVSLVDAEEDEAAEVDQRADEVRRNVLAAAANEEEELRAELEVEVERVVAAERPVEWRTVLESLCYLARPDRPDDNEPDFMDVEGIYRDPNQDPWGRKNRALFPYLSQLESVSLEDLHSVPITQFLTQDEIQKLAGENDLIKPKMEMVVIPVPSRSDPSYIQAYMVNYLVYDPTWNPGATVHTLRDLTIVRDSLAFTQGSGRSGPRWKDPLEHYRALEATPFPAFNFDTEEYLNICHAFVPPDEFSHNLMWKMSMSRFDGFSDPLHPFNVTTVERACSLMHRAGCDPRFLNPNLYWDRATGTFRAPAASPGVYRYPAEERWLNLRYISQMEQRFCGNDSFSSILTHQFNDDEMYPLYMQSEEDRMVSEEEEKRILQSYLDKMRKSPLGQPIMKRCDVIEQLGFSTSDFPTTNSMIRLWMLREKVEPRIECFQVPEPVQLKKKCEAVMAKMSPVLLKEFQKTAEYKTYQRYARLVGNMRREFTLEFGNLLQKEGGREYLAISEVLKVMLQWYQDNFIQYKNGKREEKTFTRELHLIDKDMSFFANSIVRQQEIYVQYGKVIQPAVCLTMEHSYSVYSWKPGKMKFHVIYHGEKASGKTYTVLNIPRQFAIEGTVSLVAHQTDMARFTDSQVFDRIEQHDETDERYTNSKEAAKTPRWRDLMKMALQSGVSHSEVFNSRVTKDGRTIRETRKFVTIQNLVMCCVTNKELTDPDAMADRFHQKTMFMIDSIEANKHNWKTTEQGKKAAKLYLQMLQFFSCWIKKARMCGVICEPELSVWDFVFDGVMERLTQRGIEIEGKPRIKEKLTNSVEQYVDHMTQHYLYDIPGVSPYFGQPFQVEHFYEAQRHQVCDMEMAGFVLNQHCDEIFDTTSFYVFPAIVRKYGLQWNSKMTMLQLRYADVNKKLDFRVQGRQRNPQEPGQGSGQFVNLNYIRITGAWDEICKEVAAQTHPRRLGANDVKGCFERMDGKFFKPSAGFSGRNGYAKIPKEDFDNLFVSVKDRKVYVDCRDQDSLLTSLDEVVLDYAKRVFRTTAKRYQYPNMEDYGYTATAWGTVRTATNVAQLDPLDILTLYNIQYRVGEPLVNVALAYKQNPPALTVPDEWYNVVAERLNVHDLVLRSYEGLTYGHFVAFLLAMDDNFLLTKQDFQQKVNKKCVRPKCNDWAGILTEDDIEELNYGGVGGDNQETLKILEIRRQNRGVVSIYIALEAIFMYDPDQIYQAWLETCMSKSFEPRKYLLGTVDKHHVTRLATRMVTPKTKRECLDLLARNGDNRNEGIMVEKMGEITPGVDALLFTSSLVNGYKNEREWSQIREHESSVRGDNRRLLTDIEKDAYYRQHVKAGFPLEMEVLSPQWYVDKYEAARLDPATGDVRYVAPHFNYPYSVLHQEEEEISLLDVFEKEEEEAVVEEQVDPNPARKKKRRPSGHNYHASLQQLTFNAEQEFHYSNSQHGNRRLRQSGSALLLSGSLLYDDQTRTGFEDDEAEAMDLEDDDDEVELDFGEEDEEPVFAGGAAQFASLAK